MAYTLRLRGPDDEGVWVEPREGVAFGFRRLSIQDLSECGHQPMSSASGRFTIVFNGEVYNFGQLRQELVGLGHHFRGGSDTEVMLAAFEQWGLRHALDRFNGMFAFALWDSKARTLTLVRDRIGVKPLHWALLGPGKDILAFASELKAMRLVPGFVPKVSRVALTLYTQFGYVPSPHCIFEDFQKVQPGHMVTWSAATREVTLDQWWSAREAAERGATSQILDPHEAIDAVDARLREAIKLRLIADVPVGTFLSGGVDSSLIVALASQVSPEPVHTFTVGFDDIDFNEANNARRIAAHLGTRHTELVVTAEDVIGVLPLLTEAFDEPFADSSAMPTCIVSRLARTQVTVALSGDGGDELFGGYDRYHYAVLLERRFGALPRAVRLALAGACHTVNWPLINSLLERWHSGTPGASRTLLTDRILKLASVISSPSAHDFYPMVASIHKRPENFVLRAQQALSPMTHPSWRPRIDCAMTRMMHADIVSYLPEEILTKTDRVTMANSLEGRAPFTDYQLCELAFRIPAHMKYRDGRGKIILRELLARYVPPEFMDKHKMGFGVPLDQWLRGPLKEWAWSHIEPSRLVSDGYFDPTAVRDLWESHQSGMRQAQWELWTIIAFQSWSDRWARQISATELERAPALLPSAVCVYDDASVERSVDLEGVPVAASPQSKSPLPNITAGTHVAEGMEIGHQITSGTAWGLVQAGVQKTCSIATYLTMMYLVQPADVGIATLAISLVTVMAALYPGAAGDLIIQRHSADGNRWEAAGARLAMLAGLGTLLLVLAVGPFIAGWWSQPALQVLLALAAGRILLDAATTVPLATARAQLEFRYLSILETAAALTTLMLTITAAAWGWGAYSILIPLLVVGAGRLLILMLHRPWKVFEPETWTRVRQLWPDFRSGGLQHYLNGVSQNIDYLALGVFHSDAVLGVYAIAYMIASVIGIALSFTVGGVLQPILSRLADRPMEQLHTYVTTQATAMAAATASGLALASLGGCAVRTFLPENWHGAAKPLTVLAIAFIFANPIQIARAMLRANGLYSRALALQLVTTGLLGGCVFLASWWRGAGSVAIGVLVTFAVMAPIYIAASLPGKGVRRRTVARIMLRAPLCGVAAFLPSLALAWIIQNGFFDVLAPASFFSLACLMLSVALSASDYMGYLRRFEPSVHADALRGWRAVRNRLSLSARPASA